MDKIKAVEILMGSIIEEWNERPISRNTTNGEPYGFPLDMLDRLEAISFILTSLYLGG